MRLKNVLALSLLMSLFAVAMTSCKSKISDTEIKSKVQQALISNPTVLVDVNEGIVTLSGTVQSEDVRTGVEKTAKDAEPKGIKSIVNNVEVATISINTDDADLTAKVADATKDFPTVKTVVANGVITVTGEVEQARIQTLKMSLDALNPKKVDLSGITVK